MIVVLTALEVEYAAMRRQLADLRSHRHRAGTRFEVGGVAGLPGCSVALGLAGAGNAAAAIMAERAINEFAPDALIFVGVAGGLRDWLAIGDVVVATRVYGYHGARSEHNGEKIRPRAYEASHQLEQTARALARSDGWHAELAGEAAPRIHFEPIASGEVVLNSRNSPTWERLDLHFNDAVAVETEGAGVAQCAHLHRDLPTITIRGISDHADGNKDRVDKTGSQQLAAHQAALFARTLIVATGTSGPEDEPEPRPTPQLSVVNNIHGDGHTAVQAGVVHGGAVFHGNSTIYQVTLTSRDDQAAITGDAPRSTRATQPDSAPPDPPTEPDDQGYDVFVSYAAEDADWVEEFVGHLRGHGVAVAHDVLLPGDQRAHTVERAILASKHGLLVFSQAAMDDGWIREEYEILLKRSHDTGQRFIPVVIDEVTLPLFASIRGTCDFRGVSARGYSARIDRLLRALNGPASPTAGES